MTSCIEKIEPAPFPLHELLADLRSGMTDEEVAAKYGLNPSIFEARKANALEKQKDKPDPGEGIPQDMSASTGKADKEDPVESSFICPNCLTSFGEMFDICPNCSASVQEAMEGNLQKKAASETQAPKPTPPAETATDSPVESRRPSKTEDQPAAASHAEAEEPAPSAPETTPSKDPIQREAPAPRNTISAGAQNNLEAKKLAAAKKRNPAPRALGQEHDRRSIHPPSLRCESCQSTIAPALRDIYDRSRSLHAIFAASVCFLVAFFCCATLNFFEGPSLSRLVFFFFGSLSFLIGGILTGIGAFMYLAREKVYFCPRCKRIYPRADISYVTAALVLSSKRAIGTF